MDKRWVQMSIGFAISAALVVMLVRMVDVTAMAGAVAVADLRMIGVAVSLYAVAIWVRSLVWGRLLASTGSTATVFKITTVGVAVSYIMPLRLGEVTRAYLMRRWCGIEYGKTVASLVAERVLDGLALGAILLVVLLFVPAPSYVLGIGLGVAAIFGGLVAVLLAASRRPGVVATLTTMVAERLPARLRAPVESLGLGFARGLEPLRDWRELPVLLGLALVGWLCQFAVFYFVMLALPMTSSFPVALLGGAVSILSTLLPSAPGYVGTFDAALVKLTMDVQGIGLESAASYALLVHTVLVVPVVLLGALILWRANLSLGQVLGGRPRSVRVIPGVPVQAPNGIVTGVGASAQPLLSLD